MSTSQPTHPARGSNVDYALADGQALPRMTDPPLPPQDVKPPACPRCGEPMASGYLAFGGRANWVDDLGSIDTAVGTGDTIVGMPLVRFPHLPGWRCTKCRLALLDYGAGVLYTPWTEGPPQTP